MGAYDGFSVVEEDGPGYYLVTHNNAAVRAGPSLQDAVVGRLAAGEVLHVVEVLVVQSEERVRGRIEEPAGWISLLDTKGGYRWASKQAGPPQDPWEEEKAQIIVEIRRRDSELRSLLMEAERLRAERHKSLQDSSERSQSIEAKIISGYTPSRSQPDENAIVPAMPFEKTEQAQKLEQLAVRLGMDPPGWQQGDTMQSYQARQELVRHQTLDPAFKVPDGMPDGAKVVGFRRKPVRAKGKISPKVLASPEVAAIPNVQGHGHLVDSNAILQPAQAHYFPPDGIHQAPGVYPITAPPFNTAVTNLIERPSTFGNGDADGKWHFEGDFAEARRFPKTASITPAPGYFNIRDNSQAAVHACPSVPETHQHVGNGAARLIVGMLYGATPATRAAPSRNVSAAPPTQVINF
eukprot:TRINITY_DN21558_c0_g1_i1.p1 TRINITY_DN21558_c0_g1~~TRINITY_DN21558_c0_g1_i1.p1  ORF type:complete len:407 (-),score=74.74 TRINITY_DN21558_c0_g1_i1:168-1388(-)